MRNRSKFFWLGFVLLLTTLMPNIALSATYGYVADVANGEVAVVNLTDGSIVSAPQLNGPNDGTSYVITNDTSTLAYASNYTDGSISIIDISTPESAGVIGEFLSDQVQNPGKIILNSDGSKLYVAHWIDFGNFEFNWATYISEFDTVTKQKTRTWRLVLNEAIEPGDIEINSDDTIVYISGRAYASGTTNYPDTVFAVDLTYSGPGAVNPDDPDPAVTLIPLPDNTYQIQGMDIINDNELLVTSLSRGSISLIDTSSGLIDELVVSDSTIDVVVSPDALTAYVVNKSTTTATISVVDISATSPYLTWAEDIVVGGDSLADPRSIDITPTGDQVFVTGYSDSSLTIIDTATNSPRIPLMIDNGHGYGLLGVAASREPVPSLGIDYEIRDFGFVAMEASNPLTFELTNDGTLPLTITDLGITTAPGEHFTIDDVNNCTGTTLAGVTSGITDTCAFNVNYTPQFGGKVYDTFKIITTSDGTTNDATVILSGTGISATPNANPSTPYLGEYSVNGDNISFSWLTSSDSDGTVEYYRVFYATAAEGPTFPAGNYILTIGSTIIAPAGMGLAALLLLGGALRRRSHKLLLLATLFTVATIMSACGGGGGGGGTTPPPTAAPLSINASMATYGIEPGTYHWKVVAYDEDGGATESSISTFVVPAP